MRMRLSVSPFAQVLVHVHFLSGACFSVFRASSGTSDQLPLHNAWSNCARYLLPFSGCGVFAVMLIVQRPPILHPKMNYDFLIVRLLCYGLLPLPSKNMLCRIKNT